jgi:DNA topoisomerase-3
MSKELILTEKPSVARDIAEALGGFSEVDGGEYFESDQYVCTYAVGHILTLFAPEDIDPIYKRWRLADLPIIPEKFQIKPVPGQKDRIKVIKKLANRKDVTGLINACDAAREGELIFLEVVKYLELKKPVRRLWLQSMTKDAIRNGFKGLMPGENFKGLGAVAECRAHADWLIGMNTTRALTVRLKSRNQRGMSWSAGRVQTPTLSLLVEREMEILEHVPQPYWKIQAKFNAPSGPYDATWYDPNFKKSTANEEAREDRIFDQAAATAISQAIEGKNGLAEEIRRESPKKPPALFDLTALQRTANNRFGWSATRTLRAAQRCYETYKMLTYPRTNSNALPSDYKGEVQKILQVLAGTENYGEFADHLLKEGLKNEAKVFNDEQVSDHFAIIPTGELRNLDGDDKKLFDLVTRQFMAAFYPPSIYEDVERITIVEGHHFKSKPPKVLKEAGWEKVFGKTVADGKAAFPPLISGSLEAKDVGISAIESEVSCFDTKPPARISEAGLLSLMENAGRQVEEEQLATALKNAEGLGTAATRADIIENLKLREYVDEQLRPTVKGLRLVDILHRIGVSRLTSAKLTAELELHLAEVEKGERSVEVFMGEIAAYAREVVEATKNFDFETIYPNENPLGTCPRCSGLVYEKAWFYGCEESLKRSGTKKCEFLIWKDHNGRYINRGVVKQLLDCKETRVLDGFKSVSGTNYKAVLALEGGTIVRKQVDNSTEGAPEGQEGFEINPEPLGVCPVHKGDCLVIETATDFICETKKKSRDQGSSRQGEGFGFPRTLCKREIKREEALPLVTTGETSFLTGFISKRGRKFSAKLRLDDKGGVTFVFPERTGKKGKKEEESETSEPQAGQTQE